MWELEIKIKPKCVFFLGAGFSNDSGVPLQRELLPKYLSSNTDKSNEILEFLKDIYSFEYLPFLPKNDISSKGEKTIYPQLEDIFSVIDNAIINGEYLKDYGPDKLQSIRDNLVWGIIDLIDRSEGTTDYIEEFAKVLTDWRISSKDNDPFAIITTNWDIVLLNKFRRYHDKLIEEHFKKEKLVNLTELQIEERKKLALVDYCLYTHPLHDEKNHIPSLKIKAMGFKNIKLLYLHGCPAWLYCRQCKRIYSNPSYDASKEYLKLVLNYKEKHCTQCSDGSLSPILIMPTFYKIIQNVHLLDVWQNAAMELQEADEIIFIGYSCQKPTILSEIS